MSATPSKKLPVTLFRFACLALVPAALLAACGDDDNAESAAPNTARGGSAGTSSAGSSSAGTSSAGTTSSAGKGGTGEGGEDQGGQGSAGESSSLGGSGGSAGEQSSGGSAGSIDDGAGGAVSFDPCFEDLRAPEGNFQDTEKASADQSYRMRVALETGDRFGTSGSMPWLPIRLALQTPDEVLCITDESLLADGYTGTHHNCNDVLTFSQGDREYTITSPDSSTDENDPTSFIRPSMLTVEEGGETIAGPIRLDTVECTMPDFPVDYCRSGGPC